MADRYLRQRRLPEVGDRGQAAIAVAHFHVAAGDGAETEREYLVRAGGTVTLDPSLSPAPFVHAALFQHAAPRRHAAGAWRALRQLTERLAGTA